MVVRPPPDVSLYHRKSNPLFPQVLTHLGTARGRAGGGAAAHRRAARVRRCAGAAVGVVPEHAVDAQSLVALADLVVSAGGTMNREAVALGTPVYTTYGGRLGGVDEALIREHRLRPLTDPRRTRAGEARPARGAHAARSGAAGRHDPRRRRDERCREPVQAEPRAARWRADRAAERAAEPRPADRGESLAERYAQMAHEGQHPRGVDIALRALDLAIAGVALLVLSPGAGARRARDPAHLGRPGALPRRARRAAPGASSRC